MFKQVGMDDLIDFNVFVGSILMKNVIDRGVYRNDYRKDLRDFRCFISIVDLVVHSEINQLCGYAPQKSIQIM